MSIIMQLWQLFLLGLSGLINRSNSARFFLLVEVILCDKFDWMTVKKTGFMLFPYHQGGASNA